MFKCSGRVFLILFGIAFAVIGGGIGFFGARSARADAERAQRLEPQTLVQIERGAVGREVLVEARLSKRNRTAFRNFVAYVREEYRGEDSNDRSRWVVDERVTPRLLLDMPGGLLELSNDTYTIRGTNESWQEGSLLSWNGITGEGTKRYKGLTANAQVMIVGRTVQGAEGMALEAEFVTAGTRAEYIAAQQQSARLFPWFGMIFVVVGLLIVFFGAAGIIRG